MSNQASRPRTLYNIRTGAVKVFPSGGAAKRAIELDPNWSFTPPDDLLPPSLRRSPWERMPKWMRFGFVVLTLAIVVVPAILVAHKLMYGLK